MSLVNWKVFWEDLQSQANNINMPLMPDEQKMHHYRRLTEKLIGEQLRQHEENCPRYFSNMNLFASRLRRLQTLAAKVVMHAQEAGMSMPESKIVSLQTAEFRAIRELGAAISDLNKEIEVGSNVEMLPS